MSKRYLIIIDYIGSSDENGNPLGHPLKVINQYYSMLRNDIQIKMIVPRNYRNYLESINSKDIFLLENYMDMTIKGFYGKLGNVIGRVQNILQLLRYTNNDKDLMNSEYVLWFVNIDFVLFLVLFFTRTKQRRIWVTTFLQRFSSENRIKDIVKNIIYDKSVRKIERILSSNIKLKFPVPVTYMSDYYYEPAVYDNYRNRKKQNKCVCVGTMFYSKDLDGLVRVFSKIDMKLSIIGKFGDKSWCRRLLSAKNNNITIEDRYLSNDEYHELLAEAKYVALPYKKEVYALRTSGVLLETVFMGAIPIAPRYLLEFNNVFGIGYENIDDLTDYLRKPDVNIYTNEIERFKMSGIVKQIASLI